ncbi:MAG TPA: PAS domain S-box protein [Ignavibacteriaceae bacterium]|nr:PAS domain S-box protein [Ignavibacteriaceae bacterium]
MIIKEDLNTFSVLIIEDNSSDIQTFKEYFKNLSGTSYDIVDCSTLVQGLNLLKEHNFDAVLLDLTLPDSTGVNALKAIRDAGVDLPIIVLTTENNHESGLELIKEGAQDYLFKEQLPSGQLEKSLKYAFERKHLQFELNRSLRLYEETFEQAAVGFSNLSFDGKYIKINKKFAEILGYTKEELIKKEIEEITHPDDLEEDLRNLELLIKGQIDSYIIEKRYIRKDGSIIWVSLSRTGIKLNRNEYEYMFTTIEDITERKKLEEGLKSLIKEKELLIKESHHRIKNNLQLISSLLNISLMNLKENNVKDLLLDSQNRIRSISNLHEYLYKSSDLNTVNIQLYLNNFLDHLRASFFTDERNIKLIKNINEFTIKTDLAVSIGLITNELITNAIKYAFKNNRGGMVVIEAKQVDDFVLLIIRDNGIGLDEDIKIKEAESLGFQIVHSLVLQHYGTLDYSINNGTEFYIKLKIH